MIGTDVTTMYQIQPIIKKQKENIENSLSQHYGKIAYHNMAHQMEAQKSTQQFQYRKHLMARLFDEALPKIASEKKYGIALNSDEKMARIRENFKHEANDYWIFKKLVQLRNWDYRSFLHAVDVYLMSQLFKDIENNRDSSKAALLINLGRLYIPQHILQKKELLSKDEQEIISHHALWSIEMAKGNVSSNVTNILFCHYQQVHNIPVENSNKSVIAVGRLLTLFDQYSALTTMGTNGSIVEAHDALGLLKSKWSEVDDLMKILHIYPEESIVELTTGIQAKVQQVKQQIPFLPQIKECKTGKEYNLPIDHSIMIVGLK